MKSVAVELNINRHTLKNWMKRKGTSAVGVSVKKERRPQDWNAEQLLAALHETHGLSDEALQTWDRENGLFTHHLTSWKTAFCTDVKTATGSREIRFLKEENDRLKRELTRKEDALAEVAALLILQKNCARSGRKRSNDFSARARQHNQSGRQGHLGGRAPGPCLCGDRPHSAHFAALAGWPVAGGFASRA
ncbi:hypothetical protein NTG1052_260014 [Candidatus Nitrotoga sp. 1052]|nr:hypothetical protein NTG1052_260014 [Candidatus Nitrotoga sp. 1052]